MTDLSKFSRFLNIERFAEDDHRPNKSSVEQIHSTSDSPNVRRKLNSKLLKTRSRNKSKESSEKLLTSPDTKAEQNSRPEEKNERLSTGKIKKILKSKNCTIGKLIEIDLEWVIELMSIKWGASFASHFIKPTID